MKIGFDNEKYLQMQSEHIRQRIDQFDNKLYLNSVESFLMIITLPVCFWFCAGQQTAPFKAIKRSGRDHHRDQRKDIDKNKMRGDLGITYDSDVLRLMDSYKEQGLYVSSVVITQFSGQDGAVLFKTIWKILESMFTFIII